MEKIMSKTIGRKVTETECKELVDHELDMVTGGLVVISIIQPLVGLLLSAVNREEKRS
jgi:hypothetical protein